jgi:hypothetical protein
MPKLAYIYGPHASGKGVLTRLLDGHSELAVTPFHDAFPRLFGLDFSEIEKNNIFYELREELNKTRYYRLEDIHHYRDLKLLETVEDIKNKSANINFYEIDRDWPNRINADRVDPINIISQIFSAFFEHWEDYSYKREKCQYYIGMGDNHPAPMRSLLHQSEEAKIIYINRDPRAVIASKGGRQSKDYTSTSKYIKMGNIFDMRDQYRAAKELNGEYPSRFLTIEFEDLILDHQATVDEIADFLQTGREEILYSPSICGHDLVPKDDYVGEIKDDWRVILSEDERCAVDLQMGEAPRNITKSGVSLYIYSLFHYSSLNTYRKFEDLCNI